ncbi:MAG: TPR REGION domain-containing protein, partial [Bacteroidetes bacterium]|nr:TPR REGION domain-containing protein [Bacteroidota bacterium]
RLAQSFEQSGDWERAAMVYEELYKRDPKNYVFFEGLRRSYTQVKKYDEAIDLVSHRLAWQPKDPLLTCILGGLYYEKGEDSKADSLWKLVLAGDRKNPGLYRLVASQMMDHRLYDHAIQVYLSGRQLGLDDDAFAEELGYIYASLQQYGAATQEFIRILKKSPDQLSTIENRIASFTMKQDGLKAATSVAKDEVRRTPHDVTLRSFLAWLSIEARDHESAYAQYRVIDSLRRAKGNELFNFAQRAMQERAFRVAARAFREIIDQQANPVILPQSRFGYARAIEELSMASDTAGEFQRAEGVRETPAWPVSETQPSFTGAMALYGRIITEYAHSDLAAQAHFRIGLIRLENFFDLDGALVAFEAARKSAKSPNLLYNAVLKSGEVLLAQNKLDKAKNEYASLSHATLVEYQDRSAFALAEIDYFAGAFDSSLTRLGRLTSNMNHDLANDALQLQYFIQENKVSGSNALAEFAQMDLLARQRKNSEALAGFKEIARKHATALLVDDAMMRIAEIQLLQRQTTESLATFQKLVSETPTSILRDRAQFRIGEVYQNVVKDGAKAIEAYEQLLAKFPSSTYGEEARKRIRQLRGDAI